MHPVVPTSLGFSLAFSPNFLYHASVRLPRQKVPMQALIALSSICGIIIDTTMEFWYLLKKHFLLIEFLTCIFIIPTPFSPFNFQLITTFFFRDLPEFRATHISHYGESKLDEPIYFLGRCKDVQFPFLFLHP